MLNSQDTIVAISTPPGEGGIGIVRLSGPKAIEIAKKLFSPPKKLKHFKLHHGWIKDPESGETVDEALLGVMRAPHSYTCEDVTEFQCHGGTAPLKKILELCLLCGARLAEPGEFTRRALENGRIDLSQAEAVLELIRAKTDSALMPASVQLKGEFSLKIRELREKLLDWLTVIESQLEFPEEKAAPFDPKQMLDEINRALFELDKILAGAEKGKILKDGIGLVIVGRPNVGKSSLLNRLLGEERAIVTSIPGTTRDTVEEWFNLYGIPVKLTDTAGLKHPRDEIEYLGVEKAREKAKKADVVLLVLDGSQELTFEDKAILSELKGKFALCLLNKSDLEPKLNAADIEKELKPLKTLKISAKTGTGIEQFLKELHRLVTEDFSKCSESVIIISLRQKESLKAARDNLKAARDNLEQGCSQEFISPDLKAALESLGELTGDNITEEVLDRIFSEFCIGK